ncbi:unnamed protein product, partial [Prorocentrum cordatum]
QETTRDETLSPGKGSRGSGLQRIETVEAPGVWGARLLPPTQRCGGTRGCRAHGPRRQDSEHAHWSTHVCTHEADPEGITEGAEVRPPKPKDWMDDWWSWMAGASGGAAAGSWDGKAESGGSKYLPQDQEHANLVARVKAVQKSDKLEGADRWGDFVSERGGKRDPASRTPEELAEFLAVADPAQATEGVTGQFSDEMALVAQVKNGQRNNEAFKNAWLEYCDANMEGLRDPTKHSAEGLRAFLETAPPVTAVESDEEHRKMVEQIKDRLHGQRADETFKLAWWKYCEVNGSTFMDPAKHDKAFLQAFVVAFVPGQAPQQAAAGPKAAAAAAGYGKMSGKGEKGKGKGKGKEKGKPGPYSWW